MIWNETINQNLIIRVKMNAGAKVYKQKLNSYHNIPLTRQLSQASSSWRNSCNQPRQ